MSINRERLAKRFEEEYQRLNEKQKLAVDTIDGPVMVIAGPGTGKTQILASRIGRILLDTDAYPQNILCLTYTDAGVVAMRKRLLQFIGPDAHKVNIYTYHAFCNDVIQENLFLFNKPALDPISELEKIELFKELIDTLPKGHPLKRYRGDVYYEAKNLDGLFSTMKKEGWTPEYLTEKIDQYLTDIETRDEFRYKTSRAGQFQKGDHNPKYFEELERMEKLRAAVDEFKRFQELMNRRARYDFDDMIKWVLDAFKENKNLLASYQERFQYILVDEYQDTSGTQNELIELLIRFWERPNIFVVGDDDQSIFRFQGANVENMAEFANSYKESLFTVVLQYNYRSIQSILDASKALIDNNEERLVKKLEGLTKELISGNIKLKDLTHTPLIREYETQRMEMIGIVHQVRQWLAQGVAPGRIAIIYKENKYGEELARYFKLLSIPVYSKRSLNLLELPLARKIFLVLRWMASELDISYSGDEMLFEILHFDWWGIPPIEIAKISIEVSERRIKGESISIRSLLAERSKSPGKDLFTPSLSAGLQQATESLEYILSEVPNVTLQELFEQIIRRAFVLSTIMRSPDKHEQLDILTAIFDFVKEETHRDPGLNLQSMVNLLEMMDKEDIRLPLTQVSGSDKGINLLTVHGSKGLEFEYVWLAGANAGSWEKKKKPSQGYKMPDNLFSSRGTGSEDEELRRLFYVALTRAEKHLYLSYSRFDKKAKELEPSMFIAEILDKQALPLEKMIIDPELNAEFAALNFGEGLAPEIDKIEEDLVSRVLEKFVMNVTALNNYLKCPLEFYFRNLIRIPSPKNENTEFGSSVHFALERLFRKMQASDEPKKFPSLQEFIGDFEWYMRRHRESFTPEQFARRMEHGNNILTQYYEKYIHELNKVVAVELNIRNVVVKQVPLKGKLDKLEFDGRSVNVVDYKTGDPEKGISKIKGPSEKDPNGGDYWRQAVFYKILVDNYEQKNWSVVSTEFDFVEPDKKKNYRKEKLFIKPEDITTVTQQIVSTWEKIQNREFYTGCGKEDCHWCQFVKTNNMAIDWHKNEEEETEN